MTAEPITPPVTLIEQDIALAQQDIAAVKKLTADKTALVSALVHVAVLLAMALYMKLPAKDVAVLGSIVAVANGYFTMASSALKIQAAASRP